MYNIIAIASLLLAGYLLIRLIRPAGMVEASLVFFPVMTAEIVLLGYVLSWLDGLHEIRYWALGGLFILLVSVLIVGSNREARSRVLRLPNIASLARSFRALGLWYSSETTRFEKLVLTPLIVVTLSLGILNLIIIFSTAPHNTDSISYHLARVAYYLQHHNTAYFDANYWAQVVHPRNSSMLFLYTFLVSGRNENLTQLVQFIAYCVSVCGIYGISRRVGNSRAGSLFAALVAALLTEWLMQSTTTQNDMIVTAYMAATVYLLFAFRERPRWKYLALSGLCVGLSIGTKSSSFLPLLSVGLISLYLFYRSTDTLRIRLRQAARLSGCTILATCAFALPSGYLQNYQIFGNPVGPAEVRELHAFEGGSIDYIARNGTKNLARYAIEFLSFDGMPPAGIFRTAQRLLRSIPEGIDKRLALDLESSEATRDLFKFQKQPSAHEDGSYWGLFGFGLVWGVVFLSLIGFIKSPDIRVLSLATILFLLCQAYAGPYDPWRGRYFVICAVFALPTVGIALRVRSKLIRAYLLFLVAVGSVSAIAAIVLRSNSSLLSSSDGTRVSIFAMDRMTQLTRNRPLLLEPLRAFDTLVPRDAIVAAWLTGDSFEYALFGEGLTRTVIPVNPFDRGVRPLPARAGYLLYGTEFISPPPVRRPEDIHLGADWYLRKLTDSNRQPR